jgi:phage terminase large subunit-like protein
LPAVVSSWAHGRKIIKAIYRTRRGRRIVRQALITIRRRSGKTTLTAALALCHLCGPERESRGEIYSAANDRTQAASIIFCEMKAMVLATDPRDRVIVRDFAKSLECETGSIYTALSADVQTKHGFSASFWAYDELGQAANRRLYAVLNTSGGAA